MTDDARETLRREGAREVIKELCDELRALMLTATPAGMAMRVVIDKVKALDARYAEPQLEEKEGE